MTEVVYQWRPEVVVDFGELSLHLRQAYVEQVDRIKADPKVG